MRIEANTDITPTDITPTTHASEPSVEATERGTEVATRPTRVRWFRPPLDVFESREAFRVDIDVPGVTADGLELTVDKGVLTLQARRDDTRGWRRQLRLTDGVDVDAIEAHLEAGVLSLTLPKAEAARARRIEVRGR